MNKPKVVEILNAILEAELSGVVRYTHYSLMVFGHSRLPVVSWLRKQAQESLLHAQAAGEFVTALEEHPSLKISPLLETQKHEIDAILLESLEHERMGLRLYETLAEAANGNLTIQEYARSMICEEQAHIYEVEKMLRKPGSHTND